MQFIVTIKQMSVPNDSLYTIQNTQPEQVGLSILEVLFGRLHQQNSRNDASCCGGLGCV